LQFQASVVRQRGSSVPPSAAVLLGEPTGGSGAPSAGMLHAAQLRFNEKRQSIIADRLPFPDGTMTGQGHFLRPDRPCLPLDDFFPDGCAFFPP